MEGLEARVGRRGHIRVRGGLPVTPSVPPLSSAAVPEPTGQDKDGEDDSISIGIQALELRVRNVYTGKSPNSSLIVFCPRLVCCMLPCVAVCAGMPNLECKFDTFSQAPHAAHLRLDSGPKVNAVLLPIIKPWMHRPQGLLCNGSRMHHLADECGAVRHWLCTLMQPLKVHMRCWCVRLQQLNHGQGAYPAPCKSASKCVQFQSAASCCERHAGVAWQRMGCKAPQAS